MNLLPDMGIAIYTNVIGEDADYKGRRAIQMMVLDHMLDEEPWMNASTACSFPEPWSPGRLSRFATLHKNNANIKTKALSADEQSQYEGVYGNFAYGNISVVLNNTDLYLIYGNKTTIWLLEPLEEEHMFFAKGVRLIWSLDMRVVEFFYNSNTQTIDKIRIADFEQSSPPEFQRDLLISSAPEVPYPDPCPPNKTSSVEVCSYVTGFIGLILVMKLIM